MKSLKSYLIESEQKYKFRIKMAEKFDDEIMNKLETVLEKYEVASISKPKKTPIQEHPMDFQTLNNAEVFIMDAELNYPVTAHGLYTYLTDSLSIPKSHLVVINSDHPEEIAREEAIKEEGDEYSAKLDDPDYKDAPAGKAEDSFGDKYNENMLKGLETRKYEFEKAK